MPGRDPTAVAFTNCIAYSVQPSDALKPSHCSRATEWPRHRTRRGPQGSPGSPLVWPEPATAADKIWWAPKGFRGLAPRQLQHLFDYRQVQHLFDYRRNFFGVGPCRLREGSMTTRRRQRQDKIGSTLVLSDAHTILRQVSCGLPPKLHGKRRRTSRLG